eukprot:CAMPEP_0179838050 /NCGR_PEP_ID=MMETSP0982-20121206/433_1 /TAXON_ID=483367 /ORGANISM="non described non described, Strain CCMP 2436" /LENGTH=38 /DNA_ID= /DNA_START= /DNA_END= /DNA_ORIENTATION=
MANHGDDAEGPGQGTGSIRTTGATLKALGPGQGTGSIR